MKLRAQWLPLLHWGSCSCQILGAAGAPPDCIPAPVSHHAGPASGFSELCSNLSLGTRPGHCLELLLVQQALGSSCSELAQGKESQSSSSHSEINSSQEILLLKNFRGASSWIPDSWEIQFLLFLCHWGRTGKNLSLH